MKSPRVKQLEKLLNGDRRESRLPSETFTLQLVFTERALALAVTSDEMKMKTLQRQGHRRIGVSRRMIGKRHRFADYTSMLLWIRSLISKKRGNQGGNMMKRHGFGSDRVGIQLKAFRDH